VIPTINQEGVFYETLNKKNKSSDTQYYKDYCKWAQKRISGKVRIIEYTSNKNEQAKIKAYCIAHGWDVYFSKHKDLRGD
jgi:lysine/ornithine N-monooxygenase